MKSINEKYVPTDWLKTTKLIPSNPIRSTFPKIEGVDYNLFELEIEDNFNFGDGENSGNEDLTLSFVHENNKIILTEKSELEKRNNNDNQEQRWRHFKYDLKVIDHNTQAIVYYKVELERVEIAKKEEQSALEDEPLDEHLEVIARLDDEDDDPFKTEFDEPIDE